MACEPFWRVNMPTAEKMSKGMQGTRPFFCRPSIDPAGAHMHQRVLWGFLGPRDQVAWMAANSENRQVHAGRWAAWCQRQAWLDADSEAALACAGVLEAATVRLRALLQLGWRQRHARPDRIIRRNLRRLLRWRHFCSHCHLPLHPESERCDGCRHVKCPQCQRMAPLTPACGHCGYCRLHPCADCHLSIPRDRPRCATCLSD